MTRPPPSIAAAGGLHGLVTAAPGVYLYYRTIHGGEQGLGVTGMSGKITVTDQRFGHPRSDGEGAVSVRG